LGKTIAGRFSKERLYQERQEAILQVAGEVFLEKGYHGMSMDEVAELVGIGKPTLYRHFANKEELVFALVMRDLPEIFQALETISAKQTSVQQKLEATLQMIYQYAAGTCLLLWFSGGTEFSQGFHEKRTEVEAIQRDFAERIRRLLEEGKARGEFDASVPIALMESFFLNFLTTRSYQSLIVEERMPVEDLVSYLMRLYAPR
jgi:TetR/AcrR family fatty acid metabolism transcriptional regulator